MTRKALEEAEDTPGTERLPQWTRTAEEALNSRGRGRP